MHARFYSLGHVLGERSVVFNINRMLQWTSREKGVGKRGEKEVLNVSCRFAYRFVDNEDRLAIRIIKLFLWFCHAVRIEGFGQGRLGEDALFDAKFTNRSP